MYCWSEIIMNFDTVGTVFGVGEDHQNRRSPRRTVNMVLTAIVLAFAAHISTLIAYGNTISQLADSDVTLKPVSRGYRIPFSRMSIFLSPPAVREDARGLTGDPCFASLNCTGGRVCRGMSGGECSVQSDVPCGLCFPGRFKFCSKHSQCEAGEVCARTLVDPFVCLSASFVSQENTKMSTPLFLTKEDQDEVLGCKASEVKDDAESGLTHAVRPYPNAGQSFGNCSQSSDCRNLGKCVYGRFDYETGYTCCGGRDNSECYCLPKEPEPCSNDFDCNEIGEMCMESFGKPAKCVSRGNSETLVNEWGMYPAGTQNQDTRTKTDETGKNTTVSESSCIALHHLSGISPEKLLYRTRRVARVLCDKQNSCATPGHIVKYNGISMMMSSYCENDDVSCSHEIMEVNSPRYSVAAEVMTHTSGLSFTAFAARYRTQYEEMILSALVRMGL
ncbi:hypothetical protein FGB62_327g012 [Gracilaria domingensis]|nr:hypothetical protein FGB62_327g012 [Gracilaria domingensis]